MGVVLIIFFVCGTIFASLFLVSHCVDESTEVVSKRCLASSLPCAGLHSARIDLNLFRYLTLR